MSRQRKMITCYWFLVSFTGCSYNPSSSFNEIDYKFVKEKQFSALIDLVDESEEKWKELKKSINENYKYRVSWSHPLVTDHDETEISINNNEIVGRHYIKKDLSSKIIEEWSEEKNNIGMHKNGSPALTIDDLYQQCRTKVLSRRPECNVFRVEIFGNGVLKSCYYDQCGMADSNGTGVKIEDVVFGDRVYSEASQKFGSSGCPDFYAPQGKICSGEI